MGHLVSPRPRGPRRNGRPSARPHPGAFNMADRRDMKWDLAAFGLLLLGLLVALCVFGYDPANVAAGRAFPPEDGTHFLGPLGAWLGRSLHEALGLAVYVFLTSWFVLVFTLFLRRSRLTWCLRLAGWLVLLPCVAVGADYLGPERLGGPLSGSGGSLGAWLSSWL